MMVRVGLAALGRMLQFGHGVAAVDDACRCFEQVAELLLQFGHGVAAVDDSSATGTYTDTRRCFNSATASPPWMTVSLHPLPSSTEGSFNSATASPPWMTEQERRRRQPVETLQFGHGVAAVDDVA